MRRIAVVGGGHAGFYAARGLHRSKIITGSASLPAVQHPRETFVRGGAPGVGR